MSVYAQKGISVRLFYLFIASCCYLVTLGGYLNRKAGLVLCYHGISRQLFHKFKSQMVSAARHSISLPNVGNTRTGVRYEMSPQILITFDDAFENLIENALPILKKLQIPAIIFSVPGNLGQTPQWNISPDHAEYQEKTMTALQLKEIQSDLIRIGSHTQTHPDLSKISSERIRWELVESKKNLENLLGRSVEDLALPHGAYNQDVLDIAQDVGYTRIYTLEPQMMKQGVEGKIGRFSMSPDVWPIEFYLTCCGAYSWLFYFRKLVRELRMIFKGNK